MDMWSRLIQAVHVPSKRGEDIVAGILDIWVSKYGCFEKTIHDNGGEFVSKSFVEMCDMLGVHDGTTAAHSPWSAGMIEKNHALVDRTLESLMEDFPTYSKRTLLNWAVAIKNSTVNGTGFSPFQVVFGRNPKLPCILTNDIAAMREEVVSNELMVNLNVLDRTRVRFNEAIADNAVKRMLRAKVRLSAGPNTVTIFFKPYCLRTRYDTVQSETCSSHTLSICVQRSQLTPPQALHTS